MHIGYFFMLFITFFKLLLHSFTATRLNLFNHVLALFCAKFAYILAISNSVFRWESCKSSVWESLKKYSRLCKESGTRDWISRVTYGLQAARSCTPAKHVEKLNYHASCSTTGQKVQSGRSVTLRLSQVTRPSRQPTLFWKNWLFAFQTHTSINTLYSHVL